jgi:hypothetical protein
VNVLVFIVAGRVSAACRLWAKPAENPLTLPPGQMKPSTMLFSVRVMQRRSRYDWLQGLQLGIP